eukprot:6460334-Amphidinium_carterae.1
MVTASVIETSRLLLKKQQQRLLTANERRCRVGVQTTTVCHGQHVTWYALSPALWHHVPGKKVESQEALLVRGRLKEQAYAKVMLQYNC